MCLVLERRQIDHAGAAGSLREPVLHQRDGAEYHRLVLDDVLNFVVERLGDRMLPVRAHFSLTLLSSFLDR